MTASLASSLGWPDSGPISIQRDGPPSMGLTPIPGTSAAPRPASASSMSSGLTPRSQR